MIRSALKRGIKKVFGMDERVSPTPPPPAWKAETAAPAAAVPERSPAPAVPEQSSLSSAKSAPPVTTTGTIQETQVIPLAVAPSSAGDTAQDGAPPEPAKLQWTPDERERPGTPPGRRAGKGSGRSSQKGASPLAYGPGGAPG